MPNSEYESTSFLAIRNKASGWFRDGYGRGLVHDVLHADRYADYSAAQTHMTLNQDEIVSVVVAVSVTVIGE